MNDSDVMTETNPAIREINPEYVTLIPDNLTKIIVALLIFIQC